MIKKCKWCKKKYDTSKFESSKYCDENPYKKAKIERLKKKGKYHPHC